MNILITGVGGPTPRSFVNALRLYGQQRDYQFFATDINPLAIGLYQKDIYKKSFIVPEATSPDYWGVIEKIIVENEIEYAVILPEIEVQEWSRKQKLGELPCKVLLPDYKLVNQLIDKARMTEVLEDLEVVPKSVEFHRDEKKLEKIGTHLGYPYWVRSTSGSSGLGSLLIQDRNELTNWIQINPKVDRFLASTYLPGRNLGCKMLYYEGKLLRTAVGERVHYIMAKVAPSGITGNTSFGRLLNEPEVVETAIKAMNRLFEYTNTAKHGFFTVDFKEDAAGKPYITEVNVRHVAFTQCYAAGGANFAEDTIRLLSNDKTFDRAYKMHEFEKGLIFLRDVDERPIILKEIDLLNNYILR